MSRVRLARRTVVALIALACAIPLGAQQTEDWYVGKPIKDVTFVGLATVKATDLAPIVQPYLGQPFTLELFDRLQNAVIALDYFERVEPFARDPDGSQAAVVVEFQVVERPTVASVTVEGNREVGRTDILAKVLLKPGDLLSKGKLDADVLAIEQLYLEKGYADVKASSRSEAQSDGTVAVVFTVIEGGQTRIREVRFQGNTWASTGTLRGLMKTRAQSLFDSGVFQESKLEEDKLALLEYYTDHGFVDARIDRVERTVETVEGRNELVLTVYLTEGEQWTFGGMSFEGNQVYSAEELAALVRQKPGKVLSIAKLNADIQRVVDLYTENGYIYNQIQRAEQRDLQTRSISYVVRILEFEKGFIGAIVFKGITRTSEQVLRRELPFAEGEVFNRAKIIEGYRNLYNLQYFSNIVLDTPPGAEAGSVDLVFTVEEGSTAEAKFGVTFSGGDFPISGMVNWHERNFRGKGQTLGVDVQLSPVEQSAALTFAEPWLLGVRWSAGVSLSVGHTTQTNVLQDLLPPVFSDEQASIAAPDPYATREEYLAALASGKVIPPQYLMSYESFSISLGLSTGYRWQTPAGMLGVRSGFSSSFRYLSYDELLYRPFEANVRDNLGRFSVIDKITPTVYLDGRDFYLNPTTGWYLSQGFGYTGGLLFGDRHYLRTDSVVEGFLTLLKVPTASDWDLQLILAAHAGLSLILPQFAYDAADGWGWRTVTDDTDLLYIDGMTVGRGWRQMYGKALWDNKIELRLPIAKDILTGVLFFDAAALWPEVSGPAPSLAAMDLGDFYFSFGGGLRFTIPQFPIRLYLGKGFQVQDGSVVWKEGDLDFGAFSLSFIISLGGDVF